ncbi:MAG: radical SAM protein [Bacteroidales bacterium]|nr:radical SAM protein [Bacteroidales bacterium]
MRANHVKRIVNLSRSFLGSLVIRWKVTALCNYQCDFCIQGSREKHVQAFRSESPDKRGAVAESIVRFIESKVSSRRVVELYLIGGEVTFLRDFPEILRRFVDCRFNGHIIIYVTTNFSKGHEYLSSLMDLFKGKRNRTFKILASYYRDYTSPEEFLGKVSKLIPSLSPTSLNIRLMAIKAASMSGCRWLTSKNNAFLSIGIPMIDDDSWCFYKEMGSSFRRSRVRVNPIVLRNFDTRLSQSVLEDLKGSKACGKMLRVYYSDGSRTGFANIAQLGESLEDSDGKFHPRGFYCDAGQNSFSVSPDGEVWRCPVLSPPGSFKMGEITDNGFSPLSSPTLCQAGYCSCNYFTNIRKP